MCGKPFVNARSARLDVAWRAALGLVSWPVAPACEEEEEDEEGCFAAHCTHRMQSIGRKFRDTVLSLGGGVDPLTVFKDFRGRGPSPEALLRHAGLTASAA